MIASRCTGAICSSRWVQRYDLIITNPPYVDADGMAGLPPECRPEPALAFDGGVDGLDIVRRILNEAEAHLTPQGGLLCEIGRGRDTRGSVSRNCRCSGSIPKTPTARCSGSRRPIS